jgi:aspartokinase-like uncharacterized kinase
VNRTVAKVGGSLFDLPDLHDRIQGWLRTPPGPVLLVPGGGEGANVIRKFDRTHGLGEKAAHWLAVRVLTVNAHLLAGLLSAPVVSRPDGVHRLAVLDPLAFCLADDGRPGAVAHTWSTTSDAIAARVAEVCGALLVLLKSADKPERMNWTEAAAAGLVDAAFGPIVERADLQVRWVNLRAPTR